MTPISGEKVKESSRATTVAAAPWGLWAASSTIVGERRMISRRPGEVTSAKASLTTSASNASSPPTNASTRGEGERSVLRLVGAVERDEDVLVAAAQALEADHLATRRPGSGR
jgi:hypothetical protein